MRRTSSRAAAAGIAIGWLSVAVGVAGTAPAIGGDRSAVAEAAVAGPPPGSSVAPDRPAEVVQPLPAFDRVPRRSGRARAVTAAHRVGRGPAASRSARRPPLHTDPRAFARARVAARGWSATQYRCLDLLWTRESGWQVHEANPTSGAYGIPQALPAGKLARFGADWRDSARTQIRWGLWYIAQRYGSPCAAWDHSEAYGYY